MSYSASFSLNLGVANAGLTLNAAIVGIDGKTVSHDLTGFVEIGGGCYQWYYPSFADGQRGSVVFYTGSYGGSNGAVWTASGITVLGEVALDAALENADAKISSRGTSTYAGGAVASVTGSVGSVTSGVTLANNALTTTAIANGAITSDKFTVGAVTSLASATGILERVVAVWRWCFKRKTGPFTSGQAISGNLNYYADDDSTLIGQQSAVDDGSSSQTLGAVQDGT